MHVNMDTLNVIMFKCSNSFFLWWVGGDLENLLVHMLYLGVYDDTCSNTLVQGITISVNANLGSMTVVCDMLMTSLLYKLFHVSNLLGIICCVQHIKMVGF